MAFRKGEYPRLFFSAQELPELRLRARSGLRAEMLRRLTAFCDRLLDPGDEIHFDYRGHAKPFWRVREGRWIIEPALASLAIAHAFTGELRYGEAARDAVMTIIAEKLADHPNDMPGYGVTRGWRHGGGHDKAMYARAICHVFDMCHALFSGEQRRDFIAHVRENMAIAARPEIYMSDARNRLNNRGARALVCCFGMYGLLLQGEEGVLPGAVEEGTLAAEAYLYGAFCQDGVNYEGPSYGGPGIMAEFAWMLRRSGGPDLLRNSRFRAFMDWMLYELLPGDRADVNLLNDAEPGCAGVAPAVLLPPGPHKAVLPWLMRRLDLHPRRLAAYEAARPPILPYPDLIHYILLNWEEAAPVRSPQELGYPPSRAFLQRGIADLRTGWEGDDLLLSHFCGRQVWTLHRQSDFNHVALYALGEEFLVDEGYGQAEIEQGARGGPHFRYFGRADVHNVVLFDGEDQIGNQGHATSAWWAEGRIIDWRHAPEFDSSLGDASGAYGRDHTIDRALRRVLLVRGARPFVIVIDSLRVGADGREHDFEALWRTARGNRFEVDGPRFRIVGGRNDCCGEALWPPQAQLRVVEHYRRPQLRVAHRAAELEMVTLFMPLRRGGMPPAFTCRPAGDGEFRIDAGECVVRVGTGRAAVGGMKIAECGVQSIVSPRDTQGDE
jgi:hypothetical protein